MLVIIKSKIVFIFCFITVPLYDTLGPEAIEYIVNQTEMKVIICTSDKALNILHLKEKLTSVTTVVVMDEISTELKEFSQQSSTFYLTLVKIISFKDLEQQTPIEPPIPAVLDDIATICYTSGTTGMPVLSCLN